MACGGSIIEPIERKVLVSIDSEQQVRVREGCKLRFRIDASDQLHNHVRDSHVMWQKCTQRSVMITNVSRQRKKRQVQRVPISTVGRIPITQTSTNEYKLVTICPLRSKRHRTKTYPNNRLFIVDETTQITTCTVLLDSHEFHYYVCYPLLSSHTRRTE